MMLCGLSLLCSVIVQGAGERIPAGGRASAMGGCSVAVGGFWSVCNNQAGAAWLREGSAGLSFENRFLLRELMYEDIGLAVPVKAGTFSITVHRFGTAQYNEMKAGLGYSRKFGGHFSAGVQLDYLRIHIGEGYGNKNLVSCEAGLMYRADRRLTVGLHFLNPVPVKITDHPAEQLPSVFCTALSYSFSESFLAPVEAEKDIAPPPVFRAGAEYRILHSFRTMLGISTGPAAFSFGFGLESGRLDIELASEYHPSLGFSPAGSVVSFFK
jgi:hypothetical protein